MRVQRLIAIISLLIACAAILRANPLDERRLSGVRFLGWVNLQDATTEKTIDQIWRQRMTDMPPRADGYTMVSYRVARVGSKTEAANYVKELTMKKRFSDYASKGYTVSSEPWPVQGYSGVHFQVQGTDYAGNLNLLHRADLYTFAVNNDDWFFWVEVRQVINAPEQAQINKASDRAEGKKLAEELVGTVVTMWNGSRALPVEPPKTVEPVEPPKTTEPPKTVEPVAPPKTTEPPKTVEPVAPPKTTEPPKTVEPVEPPKTTEPPKTVEPVEPPKTTEPPKTVEPVVPPKTTEPPKTVEPVTPPKTTEPPKTVEPVAPPKTTEPPKPALPAGTKRWSTPDGRLSLVLPEAWSISGKTVLSITGPANVMIRVFPSETYKSERELDFLLQDYRETQKDVSESGFARFAYTVSGVNGVQVQYNCFPGKTSTGQAIPSHTVHGYYFGKSGLLWRLEIDQEGLNTALTPELRQMIELLEAK